MRSRKSRHSPSSFTGTSGTESVGSSSKLCASIPPYSSTSYSDFDLDDSEIAPCDSASQQGCPDEDLWCVNTDSNNTQSTSSGSVEFEETRPSYQLSPFEGSHSFHFKLDSKLPGEQTYDCSDQCKDLSSQASDVSMTVSQMIQNSNRNKSVPLAYHEAVTAAVNFQRSFNNLPSQLDTGLTTPLRSELRDLHITSNKKQFSPGTPGAELISVGEEIRKNRHEISPIILRHLYGKSPQNRCKAAKNISEQFNEDGNNVFRGTCFSYIITNNELITHLLSQWFLFTDTKKDDDLCQHVKRVNGSRNKVTPNNQKNDSEARIVVTKRGFSDIVGKPSKGNICPIVLLDNMHKTGCPTDNSDIISESPETRETCTEDADASLPDSVPTGINPSMQNSREFVIAPAVDDDNIVKKAVSVRQRESRTETCLKKKRESSNDNDDSERTAPARIKDFTAQCEGGNHIRSNSLTFALKCAKIDPVDYVQVDKSRNHRVVSPVTVESSNKNVAVNLKCIVLSGKQRIRRSDSLVEENQAESSDSEVATNVNSIKQLEMKRNIRNCIKSDSSEDENKKLSRRPKKKRLLHKANAKYPITEEEESSFDDEEGVSKTTSKDDNSESSDDSDGSGYSVSLYQAKRNRSTRCKTCKKNFANKKTLLVHQRIHRNEFPFSCRTCCKKFRHLSTLSEHEEGKHANVVFICETCHGEFTSKKSLVVHQRGHKQIKPYQCSFCSKQFAHNGTVVTHERSHTGEKPFVCQECDTSLADKSNLRRHRLTHIKSEKSYPFGCSKCDKRFKHKESLNNHQHLHAKNSHTFIRKLCRKTFFENRNFEVHVCNTREVQK